MISPTSANMPISDYCAAMERGEIRINRAYQRSDKVWPPAAQSYLIESIILGYPVPKIYHDNITNLQTGRSVREIIDGQQRSRTIKDFREGKFRLSGPKIHDDLKGRYYDDLEDEHKQSFLTYVLSIDMFSGARPPEIRQVFRRMNSYTVPLNPEELRHATYQGDFKWFIASVSEDYQETLKSFNILTEKSLTRMQDLKLLTECAHAFAHGVRTTNKNKLDGLYEEFDETFAEVDLYESAFSYALSHLQTLDNIPETNLAKPYIAYAIIVALLSHRRDIPDLENPYDQGEDLNAELIKQNLERLSEALELDEDELEDSAFADFVGACSARTNVRDQRETRIRWFMRAFEEDLSDL
jgi:hypothetical protein